MPKHNIRHTQHGEVIPYTVTQSMTDIDTLPPGEVYAMLAEKERVEKIVRECWKS